MTIEKLAACFKRIGFNPDITKFDDRMAIQKIAYLMKLKGIDVGFNFGLYIRGPYSPGLASAIYAQRSTPTVTLSENECKIADELKDAFENLDPSALEIAATYAYFIAEGMNHIDALKRVKQMKNFHSQTLIILSVNKTKKLMQYATPKLIEEMRNEFKEWEEASIKDGLKQ